MSSSDIASATAATPRKRLRATIELRAAIEPETIDAMWRLFEKYYAEIDRSAFERDLENKDHVIVLRDKTGAVQGFSTLAVYQRVLDGKRFQVIFSGDTIVEQAYWGQTILQRAFLSYVIRRKLARPHLPTYWFLITKGYKTYLLLARNFLEYWPRFDAPTPDLELRRLTLIAEDRFGAAFQSELGILRFEKNARLRERAAPIDARALELPEVRFFLKRNPNHAEGEELCCLGRIDGALWVHYMSKLARRAVGLGRA